MNKKVDLIIVGGGILGTAHAYWALSNGFSVSLFERDPLPNEATVRNFGQVVPSGLAANEWQHYGIKALETYKSIQKEFDLTVRANGSTYIASNEEEVGLIEELHEINKNSGYRSILWTKSECLNRLGAVNSDYCQAALHFPDEITIEAPLMIHRFHSYLKAKFENFNFFPNTTITQCEVIGDEVKITSLSNEQYSAERVIVCNGRDFKHLFSDKFAQSGIKVVKLNMLESMPYQTVVLDGNILTGLTIRRYEAFEQCPSYNKRNDSIYDKEYFDWGIHILFKRTPQNTLIIGDSHEYASIGKAHELGYSINEYVNELILKEAKRILKLPHWKMARTWAGYYTQLEESPIYHEHIDGKIQLITAIGGKGMSTSLGYAFETIKQMYDLA